MGRVGLNKKMYFNPHFVNKDRGGGGGRAKVEKKGNLGLFFVFSLLLPEYLKTPGLFGTPAPGAAVTGGTPPPPPRTPPSLDFIKKIIEKDYEC